MSSQMEDVRSQVPDYPIVPYPIKDEDEKRMQNDYQYHAPKPGQPERYTEIRKCAGIMARMILEQCPPSRERSVALTHIENSVFYANAAIARYE